MVNATRLADAITGGENLRHGGPEISSLTARKPQRHSVGWENLMYKCVKAEDSSEFKTLHKARRAQALAFSARKHRRN